MEMVKGVLEAVANVACCPWFHSSMYCSLIYSLCQISSMQCTIEAT
jgi:hypothetical protein